MSTPKRGTYVIRLVLTPRSALCRSNFVSFWHGAWVFSLMGNSDSFQDKFVYVVDSKTPRNPTSFKHPLPPRVPGLNGRPGPEASQGDLGAVAEAEEMAAAAQEDLEAAVEAEMVAAPAREDLEAAVGSENDGSTTSNSTGRPGCNSWGRE